MSNKWVEKTKAYANDKKISYQEALSDPINRLNHHRSAAIGNGMNPMHQSPLPSIKYSGYNPYKDKKVMNDYANLAKIYNNSTKKK